jgi:hypothetical protein
MKKIDNIGNLPKNVGAFAVQLKGVLIGQKETEFWEAANITEFEKQASEIGYEIVPAMDMATGRGYLVGFDVEESPIKGINQSYAQLKMYFIEVSLAEFTSWVKKIKEYRADQELDSAIRKGTVNKSLLTP